MQHLRSLCCLLSLASVAAAAERPNVVLFIADDMTCHDCGAYGSQVVKTPSIDRLAAGGMTFERMFTSTAMCAPTRQQLYTGLWPVRSGAYPNHSRVYDGTRSWVHHFEGIGYRCGLSGKNHCSPPASYPWEQIVPAQGPRQFEAIREFIARDAQQPYFLVVAHRDPHTPWNHGDPSQHPPEQMTVPAYLADTPVTREELAKYYAEITFMDGDLGRVIDIVDESPRRENTIVIFTSEQGSAFPFGGKWTCYENGLRTAFVVRWPARVEAGSKTGAMCQYVDVVPTLLEAAGADPRSLDTGRAGDADGGSGFDGRSFLPVLLGERDRHRDYVYGVHTTRGIINGTDYPIRSVRGARFKYIRNLNAARTFTNAATRRQDAPFASWLAHSDESRARADAYQHRPAEELYDLQKDPFELNNLAGRSEHAEVQRELGRRLDEWMQQQGDKGMATELRADERRRNNRRQRSTGGAGS